MNQRLPAHSIHAAQDGPGFMVSLGRHTTLQRVARKHLEALPLHGSSIFYQADQRSHMAPGSSQHDGRHAAVVQVILISSSPHQCLHAGAVATASRCQEGGGAVRGCKPHLGSPVQQRAQASHMAVLGGSCEWRCVCLIGHMAHTCPCIYKLYITAGIAK